MSDIPRSVLSYNKFLRESCSDGNTLTMDLLSQPEQVLALETILTFVQHMSSGKGNDSCRMKIELAFGDSERSQS